jgi:putative ATP-dependent endonuclease of OLD family
MKVRHLDIKNFKGLKSLQWTLPNSSIVALIGIGDSSKTSILEAIKFTFHPHWTVDLNDNDFYNANTSESIEIKATIGCLPDEFLSLTKYGLHLRGWDSAKGQLNDEPQERETEEGLISDENVLTILFSISSDLEPHWKIITDRNPEGIAFPVTDRRKINAMFIGAYSDRLLSWNNQSPLSKLTDDTNLQSTLASIARSAKTSFNANRSELKELDVAANKAYIIAKSLGIQSKEIFQSHLDLSAINIRSGGISLHEGNIPVRQLGLGSRRILACGLQTENLDEHHITLIDEIEHGLEPHRISRLLKHIKKDTQGVYFFTTHNPTVLRELDFVDLNIVHRINGEVNIFNTADNATQDFNVQGALRACSDVFLCPKVVICEGATEVGFLRGIDDYNSLHSEEKEILSYHGVGLLNVDGGSQVRKRAETFNALSYQVAIFADSDAPTQFSLKDEKELEKNGVIVVTWADNLALEQRIFIDLPWPTVQLLLLFAQDELGLNIHENVQSKYGRKIPTKIIEWQDNADYRKAIGLAACKSSWFKNITLGEKLGYLTASCLAQGLLMKTDIDNKLTKLWEFIER